MTIRKLTQGRGGKQVSQDSAPQRPSSWNELSHEERFTVSLGGAKMEGTKKFDSSLEPLRKRLIATDTFLIIFSIVIALGISSRASTWAIDPTLAIYGVPPAIGLLWLSLLGIQGSYDQRIIGLGTEEIKRVISATLVTFAFIAGISYLIRADISRAYAYISLPLGLILIICGRFYWRGWLYRARARGKFMNSTVVIGSGITCDHIIHRLTIDTYAGFKVVGQITPPTNDHQNLENWMIELDELLQASNANAVAYMPSEDSPSDTMRQLAWHLEGRNIDLLIAPMVMDIVGPRLSVRPAAGVPLLHLDEARLTKPQRASKRALDLVGGFICIVLLSPVMIVAALVIRLTSKGPILFKQTRIGRSGLPFKMLKFRTMIMNADQMREKLREEFELQDPMFKMKDDPRITKVGKPLRRWSIDELPQLFNVIAGSMSLVGPRPHPLDDVERYEVEAYRRLALKPGLTGLWQVEGRSDLDWAEALQLDLYYVETWSLASDIVLLARTIRAVLQGRGAK